MTFHSTTRDVMGTVYADTWSKSACGNNGYDYDQIANPPILHRKETFLHPAHPLHAKFARLGLAEGQCILLPPANYLMEKLALGRGPGEAGFRLTHGRGGTILSAAATRPMAGRGETNSLKQRFAPCAPSSCAASSLSS